MRINDGYRAELCRDCDFLVTRFDREPLGVNEDTYQLKDRVLAYYLRETEFESRYDGILQLLRRHARIGRLLEVGSNIGVFAEFVRRQGVEVDSVEMNEACRVYQRIAYRIDAVEDISELAGRRYEAIVLMDVLEHIPGPVEYLSGLKGFLSAGGLVFLQFPNKNSWVSRIAGEKWGWWAAPDHLYHFSQKAVCRAAEKSGFRVVFMRNVSPVADDLGALPVLRVLHPALRVLARWMNTNPLVELDGGSLIQAILKPHGGDNGGYSDHAPGNACTREQERPT